MDSTCDRCKSIFPSLTECCYGHKFCSECLVLDGHEGKFTCITCNKEICNSYHAINNQCQQCIFDKAALLFKSVCITCNKETVDEYGKDGECVRCIVKKLFNQEIAKGNLKLVLESIRNVPEFSPIFENPRYKEYIDRVCKE